MRFHPIERPFFGQGCIAAKIYAGGRDACRLRRELGCLWLLRNNAQDRTAAGCEMWGRSSAVALAIESADIEKGAAQPLRFPSVGRSLNSRGFSNPQYSAHRAKAV